MPRKKDVLHFPFTESSYSAEKDREENIVGKKIQLVRNELGYSLDDLSKALTGYGVKVSRSGIGHWESGRSIPNAYQFLAICHALGIQDLDYYSGNELLNLEGMRKLSEYKSDLIATGRYSPKPPASAAEIPYVDMRVAQQPAAAGLGEFLSEDSFEVVSFPASAVPANADFGIKVSGDSMEPVYHDGSIVWVQKCATLNPGEVGIFVYDNEGYIKAYSEKRPSEDIQDAYLDSNGVMHNQPVLISYNKSYPPKIISPELSFSIIGRVLN